MILADVDPASYSVILDGIREQQAFIKWLFIGAGPVIAGAFAWIAKQGAEARQEARDAKATALTEVKAAAESRRQDREREIETRLKMHDENQAAMDRLADAVESLARQHGESGRMRP